MSVIQAGMIGVIGVMLAVQLKGNKSEYGVYVSVAVSVILFVLISERLGIFVRTVKDLVSYSKIETSYFSVILKMLGITYIAEFASGICKDAGYQTIAGQIETFGKLTILALGMPILTALLGTIREFLS
ncbi:SpoIIIAC/SpoIIIAD family protein [Mediterraneibacter sp.]|uniref:SpoIIIAC/SpoIIIAD family protein n=1 Tax=Mediterraneibacter sp. TaxID=2316022 RepID=UPI0015A8EE0F|nr:SpoIIIAC/SpoIIIAD family protein [Mediterraneibacter sp.]